jgi:alpha-tubulin suppressor-like RCC1 family protein
VRSDGTVACWGRNVAGQATPPAGAFTQVAAGFEHSCGVGSDGTAACWGTNSNGQLTPPPFFP